MLRHGKGENSLQKSGQLIMAAAAGALWRSDGRGRRIGGMSTGVAMRTIESSESSLARR